MESGSVPTSVEKEKWRNLPLTKQIANHGEGGLRHARDAQVVRFRLDIRRIPQKRPREAVEVVLEEELSSASVLRGTRAMTTAMATGTVLKSAASC